MSDPVIKVDGLSKEYILGGAEFMDTSFREMLTDAFSAPFKRFSKLSGKATEEERFWALKDVSFNIQQGEVVGIIGRNGAGKSTLLKILCRITAPTHGRIELEGRVASLLEVGTGFHPELTGRENIYLNGAILGMKQIEIKKKFDDIVDFAEINKFLDTPVKRYSSGMYVRLAFAVAANLEPEILLVDEVLAVGDIAFQNKCLGKMQDFSTKEGRTVIFVSHNMGAINRLCHRCIWLSDGVLQADGEPPDVVSGYLIRGAESNGIRTWSDEDYKSERALKLRTVKIGQSNQIGISCLDIDIPFFIDIDADVCSNEEEIGISLKINRYDGECIVHTAEVINRKTTTIEKNRWRLRCNIPAHTLNVGKYFLSIAADIPFRTILLDEQNIMSFTIQSQSQKMGRYNVDAWKGAVGPFIAKWTIDLESLSS